jgi:hypothetical protein
MALTLRGQGRFEILHGCAQASTNSFVVLDGSELDARAWRSLEYSLTVLGNDVDWAVYGDNAVAFGTEVCVQVADTIVQSASGSFSVANAHYEFYRIKIKSTVAETVASACTR